MNDPTESTKIIKTVDKISTCLERHEEDSTKAANAVKVGILGDKQTQKLFSSCWFFSKHWTLGTFLINGCRGDRGNNSLSRAAVTGGSSVKLGPHR